MKFVTIDVNLLECDATHQRVCPDNQWHRETDYMGLETFWSLHGPHFCILHFAS